MAEPKRTQYTLPLMIIAFLTIAGFIYWLSASTQAVRVAIAEDEAAAQAEEEANAGPVDVDPKSSPPIR